MKKNLLIFFTLITTVSFSETNLSDLPSGYSIIKSEKDSKLKSAESVFEFSFNVWKQKWLNNNIKMSYNEINKTAVYDSTGKFSLKIKPGKYVFKFFATSNYFEITTDTIIIQPGFKTQIQVDFQSSEVIQVAKKPVIYVYPEESTEVKITMDPGGEFLFTYPEYKNGWNFTADANGTIHIGDKKYDYLFWDGKLKIDLNKIKWNEGFIVKKEEQINFFEEKLSQMGLSSREIEDYITYWCPLMNVNEKNYIHFIFNEEYDQYAKMNITPKPDKIFRVYMMWAKSEGNTSNVTEQKLQSFSRSGFTVVEWGGTEMNHIPNNVTLHI